MRLLTLLLPSLALAALANATSECASALQLQDTVRSSLRSKENELGIRELKSWAAEQKSSMDKAVAALERAVAEQKSFAEKAVEMQKTASNKAVEEQKSSMDKAVAALERAVAEQKSFAEKAVEEQKTASKEAVEEQKTASNKAVEEQKTASKEAATAAASAASWANAEVRVLLGLGAAGFLFLVASPQRAIAMLRAYMGPQHAPP